MRIAMIGLGKMGANMARRLLQHDIEVIGYNRSTDIIDSLVNSDNLIPAESVEQAMAQLTGPRIVWLMLPAGETTENMLQHIRGLLSSGDIVIDGGNANYHDSQRRAASLAAQSIGFIDVGTSGGIWGLEKGYCLMAGGSDNDIQKIEPLLRALAPTPESGWAHVGPVGAGHFCKMIHNGVEYGMMQAYAEGFALLQGKTEFNLDLAQLAELWRHGSVVRSWLLDLMADFLQHDQRLDNIAPYVADSGEGRWTIEESIHQGVAAPVLALALHMRFASQDNQQFGNRLLAKMREAFGGHGVKEK